MPCGKHADRRLAFAGPQDRRRWHGDLAISAVGVTTTVPAVRTVTMDVAPLAAIDESSDTIGFADSDLYGMTPAQIDAQLDQMQAMGVTTSG